MKRLIKKSDVFDALMQYDINNRECAIVYINGEIIEGKEHWGIIKDYFLRKNIDIESPEILEEIDNILDGKYSNPELLQSYATADKINDVNNVNVGKSIMVHGGSIDGISEDELFSILKQKYSDYNVISDDDLGEILDAKTAKLIKKSYDSKLDISNYVIPGEPLYCQDYFLQRDPKRLQKIKELHDKNQYLDFMEITKPTMTAGLAMNKINKMPGDVITLYHGTGSQNIDSIYTNGLQLSSNNSYQNSASYGEGIWLTLDKTVAEQYAKDSANGFEKENQDSDDPNITQYFGYGAIFEFSVNKDMLTDEGSASNNNIKSLEAITPDKIVNMYIFEIATGKYINY